MHTLHIIMCYRYIIYIFKVLYIFLCHNLSALRNEAVHLCLPHFYMTVLNSCKAHFTFSTAFP